MNTVREHIIALPVAAPESISRRLPKAAAVTFTDIASLIAALREDLLENHRDISSTPDRTYTFHFELVRSQHDERLLSLFTVLTSPPQPGSTRYGNTIGQTGDEQFTVWKNY